MPASAVIEGGGRNWHTFTWKGGAKVVQLGHANLRLVHVVGEFVNAVDRRQSSFRQRMARLARNRRM